MEFVDDAFVYDEKVTSARVFEKQRVRWLEAQLSHIRRFFDDDMKTSRGSFLFYNKLFQNLLLPRVLTLVVFCLLIVILIAQLVFRLSLLQPSPVMWFGMMCLYFFTLFISIPRNFYSLKTVRALSSLPLLMYSMIRAVSQMKRKRTEFLHTPKSFTEERN